MQHDQYYLDILRNLVVEKAGMGEPTSWTQTDILLLIEAVEEASKITLSVNTVKRFFGLLKVSDDYLPQRDTRDAFAKYVGHANGWKDLVVVFADNKTTNKENGSDLNETNYVSSPDENLETANSDVIYGPRKLQLFVTGLVLLSALLTVSLSLYSLEPDLIEVNQDGYAPITKVWAIKKPFFGTDAYYLDYDVHEGKVAVKPGRDTSTHTYQVPAVSFVKLYHQDRLIKAMKTISYGAQRVCLYQKAGDRFGVFSSSINSGDTALFVPAGLTDPEIDSTAQTARAMLMWLKPLGVNLESTEWELKLEHLKRFRDKGIYPRLLQLALDSKESQVYIILRDKGFNKYSYLQIGDLTREGASADLSALQFDLANLKSLKVTINQKTLSLIVNGQQLYQTRFKSLPGELCGITVTATPVYGITGETVRNTETGAVIYQSQSNLK